MHLVNATHLDLLHAPVPNLAEHMHELRGHQRRRLALFEPGDMCQITADTTARRPWRESVSAGDACGPKYLGCGLETVSRCRCKNSGSGSSRALKNSCTQRPNVTRRFHFAAWSCKSARRPRRAHLRSSGGKRRSLLRGKRTGQGREISHGRELSNGFVGGGGGGVICVRCGAAWGGGGGCGSGGAGSARGKSSSRVDSQCW